MDWVATVLLMAGYTLLPRRKRAGVLVIAASDVAWVWYAAATGQAALGFVSVFCFVFAVGSFVSWKVGDE